MRLRWRKSSGWQTCRSRNRICDPAALQICPAPLLPRIQLEALDLPGTMLLSDHLSGHVSSTVGMHLPGRFCLASSKRFCASAISPGDKSMPLTYLICTAQSCRRSTLLAIPQQASLWQLTNLGVYPFPQIASPAACQIEERFHSMCKPVVNPCELQNPVFSREL